MAVPMILRINNPKFHYNLMYEKMQKYILPCPVSFKIMKEKKKQ